MIYIECVCCAVLPCNVVCVLCTLCVCVYVGGAPCVMVEGQGRPSSSHLRRLDRWAVLHRRAPAPRLAADTDVSLLFCRKVHAEAAGGWRYTHPTNRSTLPPAPACPHLSSSPSTPSCGARAAGKLKELPAARPGGSGSRSWAVAAGPRPGARSGPRASRPARPPCARRPPAACGRKPGHLRRHHRRSETARSLAAAGAVRHFLSGRPHRTAGHCCCCCCCWNAPEGSCRCGLSFVWWIQVNRPICVKCCTSAWSSRSGVSHYRAC